MHLDTLEGNDVVVYDRGYYSYALLHHHRHTGIHAIFRLQATSHSVIQEFSASTDTDRVVTISPSEGSHTTLRKKHPDLNIVPVQMRLLKYEVAGSRFCLGTTLLDRHQRYPIQDFMEVYHSRWGVEELYKVSKRVFGIEDFHAKTERGVKQERFAHFVLITMNRLFANRADLDLNGADSHTPPLESTEHDPSTGSTPRIQPNFKNCIHILQRSLEELLLLTTEMQTAVQRAFVPLDRLDEATTSTLAAQLRAEDTLEPRLAARLWSETEGNPLFVIEAVRAGISLERSQAVLTPTMRAVLRARLGQLPDGARRLAEVAAVIGRPFSVGLMVLATGIDEDELVDHVDVLWRRRIIRDQGPAYDFQSRQAARGRPGDGQSSSSTSNPPGRRRGDRGRVPRPHRRDQAGMVEPAIDAYRVAGARAVAVSALDEAVTTFRRALTLLAVVPASPDRDALELDVRIALGSPLVAIEGYGSKAAHRLYERARALCRKLERPVAPPILRGLGLARLQGCRFDDCDELAQALLDDTSRDPVARTEGRYLLGVSAFWRGDLGRARHYLDDALEAYDLCHRDVHLALFAQDPRAVCLVRLALVELWAGDAGRADETARSAVEIAVDLDHLMTLGYVVTYAAIGAAESEDLARLAELLGDADLLWRRLSMRYLMVVGEALRGWLDVCEGSTGGIEKIVRSVVRSRTEGETLHLTYTLLLLARARGIAGEFRQGRAATREGLSWSHRSNQLSRGRAVASRRRAGLSRRRDRSRRLFSAPRRRDRRRPRGGLVGASGAPLPRQSISRPDAA